MMIKLRDVTISYEKNKPVLENVSLEMEKGKFYGIIGPNGSGKTSLLNTINGTIQPQFGQVKLQDKEVSSYSSKELAKLISTLPQHVDSSFTFTVKESVYMGRYAHKKSFLPQWNEYDEEIVLKSIEQTKMSEYMDTSLDRLSGGERQRAFLARSLAQESKILLLDEPTNHLDLSHQINLMNHIKQLVHQNNLTVVGIFHDLNIASVFCDALFLVQQKKVVRFNKKDYPSYMKTIGEAYSIPLWSSPHETVHSVAVQPILADHALKPVKENVITSNRGIELSRFYRLFGRIEGKAIEEWNDCIELENHSNECAEIDFQALDKYGCHFYKISTLPNDQRKRTTTYLCLIQSYSSSLEVKSLWMDLYEELLTLTKREEKISFVIGSMEWKNEKEIVIEDFKRLLSRFIKNST